MEGAVFVGAGCELVKIRLSLRILNHLCVFLSSDALAETWIPMTEKISYL